MQHGLEIMQDRIKFPLTSEQCELLVVFESAESLTDLAKAMHKDASVISRNLQRLAETGVLEKNSNRWTITALGRQVNNWTRAAATSQAKIFDQQTKARLLQSSWPSVTDKTALVLVGLQNGFEDPVWGRRNHLHAEDNILKLLQAWRFAKRPIYHIQHLSRELASPLKPGTLGAEFRSFASPLAEEVVISKSANSAFAGTNFESRLRERGHQSLVIAGFTTNHCVDATTRSAADLGFSVFVVSDACVAFDRASVEGSLVKAEETHRVVMANLNQEFATVIETAILLEVSREQPGIHL
jgi:nicotinamidase-related amidase